jgi:hypothetical protein
MFHRNLTGNDLHAPSRETVFNNTGSTLPKLKVVRVSGMGTAFPTIAIADPLTYQNFGIVTDDIVTGQAGKACCLGFMFGVDTSAWAPDTILYSDVSGNLSATVLGTPVASVIKQDATTGVLYVTAISDQITPPSSSSWGLSGNTVGPSSFLGPINNEDIRFRTNNTQKATLTRDGRFGLGQSSPVRHVEFKAHTGVNSTGLQIESMEVSTNTNTYQDIYVMTLADPSLISVEFTVHGKDSVTGELCVFRRQGSFYRSASSTQLMPQGWQSTYTSKTNNNFNITYTLGVSDVTIRVKAAANNTTNWVGCAILQELKL